MKTNFLAQFRSARRCSVPLVAIKSPDPASTIASILSQECKVSGHELPAISWDCIRGFRPLNESSRVSLANMTGNRAPDTVLSLREALKFGEKLPQPGLLFAFNADGQLDLPACQAVWNLRDLYPSSNCTLVLLGPEFALPARISGDVLLLEEPLPDASEIEHIVHSVYAEAKAQLPSLPALTDYIVSQAVKAGSGLASFPVSQSVAMSISQEGLDVEGLWTRKHDQIQQTPGLSVWSGDNDFENVKDCDNVVTFLRKYLPNVSVVVFLDEIGDAFAGVAGDSSGVSQKMHGALLTYMEDNDVNGMLFLGHPGTGKSEVAKCCGENGKRPVIAFDVAKMESRFVGDSTNHLYSALKVVTAVGQGKALFIGTCNSMSNLTPQMRRRFKLGTFFFDLPSLHGRVQLWKHYCSKYGVTQDSTPFDDTGWTGAEIRTCCKLSHDLGISLCEASKYIVPITRSAAESIESLNRSADGKFISSAYAGPFQLNKASVSKPSRKFNTEN